MHIFGHACRLAQIAKSLIQVAASVATFKHAVWILENVWMSFLQMQAVKPLPKSAKRSRHKIQLKYPSRAVRHSHPEPSDCYCFDSDVASALVRNRLQKFTKISGTRQVTAWT